MTNWIGCGNSGLDRQTEKADIMTKVSRTNEPRTFQCCYSIVIFCIELVNLNVIRLFTSHVTFQKIKSL
jgi:hypothetical protein